MTISKLTFDEVNEALRYDPDNGQFYWKVSSGKGVRVGDTAGTWKSRRISNGETKSYLYLVYKGRTFTAAQAAWLLQTGEWPEDTVLFVDGNTKNLRFNNLKLPNFPSNKTIKAGVKSYKMTKDAQRHYGLKRNYGITLTEYSEMHKSQDGKCAICGNPETTMLHGKIRDLSVDHCHKSGKIRQLLCNACNHILGESKENKQILSAAIAYLEKHEATDDLGDPSPQTGLADVCTDDGDNPCAER